MSWPSAIDTFAIFWTQFLKREKNVDEIDLMCDFPVGSKMY